MQAAHGRAYSADLAWFEKICRKHVVDQLGRSDAMALFAARRAEDLNQRTINKRVIVMLQAMRRAGAHIQLHKGDWPKTVDKDVIAGGGSHFQANRLAYGKRHGLGFGFTHLRGRHLRRSRETPTTALVADIYELFQDDAEAQFVMDGWKDGLSGTAIMETLEIDQTKYERASRDGRRKAVMSVNKRWTREEAERVLDEISESIETGDAAENGGRPEGIKTRCE